MRRDHWKRYNERLDPATDFVDIYAKVVAHEFPWDMNQALGFALFRTYAVPGIGRLLDETGEFTQRTQKRYDDTALLLEPPNRLGFDDPEARAAIRRINQMHRAYDIPDHQFRYVLSTFVVVPKRWLDEFGKRPLTPHELEASVQYYRTLGRHLGIADVPETYAGFEELMDSYEAEHFGFDEGGRRVADATLSLMSRLATTLLPYAMIRTGRSAPAEVRLVLTGRGGGTFTVSVGEPLDTSPDRARLIMDTVQFCRVVANRLADADVTVDVSGDAELAAATLAGARSLALD